VNHGQIDHGFTRLGLPFVVAIESAVIAARAFPQLIFGINRTTFGSPASGTPTAVRGAVVYGLIQRSAISAGLTTGDDFQVLVAHRPKLHSPVNAARPVKQTRQDLMFMLAATTLTIE
jgi:hypothetical protein